MEYFAHLELTPFAANSGAQQHELPPFIRGGATVAALRYQNRGSEAFDMVSELLALYNKTIGH